MRVPCSILVCVALVAAPAAASATVRLRHVSLALGSARAVVDGTISPAIDVTARIVLGSARLEVIARGSLASLTARGSLHAAGIAVPFTAHANLRAHRLDSFVANVLGAEVTLDPVTVALGRPTELAFHVRGLALARVLPAQLQATGTLDGELAIRIDRDGASLRAGTFCARAPGRIRVTDTSWLPDGDGLKHRLAGTLADFAYAQLAIDLAPRGSDPDIRLAIRGHGAAIPQQLDLVVNLHGARDVAQRLIPRVWRSS
ncbi:MAG: YdbH domain-containing protein [Acidobacteriota bacterium]